jgi:hypothetical protein
MKEPLQKVLRQLLDEISDQKFADLVFRLFVSMPDKFYTGLAYYKNPIPLVEHLILTAVFAFRRVKKWGKGRPRRIVQRMINEVITICLFHDFWKFDWTQKPPKRIKRDHGYVSGDKMFEFIKEADFPKKTKNRIVGTIFFHMDKGIPKPIEDGRTPKRTRAGKFLKGSDGKTYRIYKNKTRMFNQPKVIECTQDCK